MTSFGILYEEATDVVTGERTVNLSCQACEWTATFGGAAALNADYIQGYADGHAWTHQAATLTGVIDLPVDSEDKGARPVCEHGHSMGACPYGVGGYCDGWV